jgi:regulator of PEP synthase PpsR (kinase-PPPase family)
MFLAKPRPVLAETEGYRRGLCAVPCHSTAAYLGTETAHRVGAQHTIKADYFKRIDALNYTMLHDDGQHIEDLEEADVVLVGVTQPMRTTTSVHHRTIPQIRSVNGDMVR